jgi:hypothetical protein
LSKKKRSWVFVSSLDPQKADSKKTRELNPNARPGAPCVFVSISWFIRPEERYPESDFSGSKSKTLRRLGLGVLEKPRSKHTNKEGALSAQARLIEELRRQGWIVYNRPAKRTHHVYVVELTRGVGQRPGVQKRNPDRRPGFPCVYVGQSKYEPKERLARHLAGKNASKYVTEETVVRLRPDIFETLNPLTELDSLREERHLASRLRKSGFSVVGGH